MTERVVKEVRTVMTDWRTVVCSLSDPDTHESKHFLFALSLLTK